MSDSVVDTSVEAGIERASHEMLSLAVMSHPSHAREVVRVLHGHFSVLLNSEESDPLLYAYLLRDHLPQVAGLVINLEKWSYAVVDATPDQLYETGA